jgi:hypothetical protein
MDFATPEDINSKHFGQKEDIHMIRCANYAAQHQRRRSIFLKIAHSLVQFGIGWLIGSIYTNC